MVGASVSYTHLDVYKRQATGCGNVTGKRYCYCNKSTEGEEEEIETRNRNSNFKT